MTRMPPSPPTAPTAYLTSVQARNVFSWSRFLIVMVLLLMQLLTLLGLLWVNKTSSERAIQTQARSALGQLVRVTADNTRAYLQAAADVVHLTRATINTGQMRLGSPEQQATALNAVLHAVPQVDGAMIGRRDGSFVFVRHSVGAVAGGHFVRVIEVQPVRRVTDATIGAAGQISGRQVVQNPYDPRARPWYKMAQSSPGEAVWTEPYVFASSRAPGITVASTLNGSQSGADAVVAMDVQLSGLAGLLQSLQVSAHGRAFIADQGGHAIAASRAWPNRVQGRIPKLSEVGDPPLQALLAGKEVLKVNQEEPLRLFRVKGERYAAVLREVEVAPGMRWIVGVYAPEADFTGELGTVYRQQLWAIVMFTLFSMLLAWPLAFQATKPLAFLQRQATTDPLTGLSNRASFLANLQEELRQAPSSGGGIGVAMLDLDGFKSVNDTFGHGIGDEVLRAIGARLLSSVRAGDTLGRLGGDEFALILQGDNRERIRLRIEGIIHELTYHPVMVEGKSHSLGATVGLAFYDRATRQSSDELLAEADRALMNGKRHEKGRVWVVGESPKTILD